MTRDDLVRGDTVYKGYVRALALDTRDVYCTAIASSQPVLREHLLRLCLGQLGGYVRDGILERDALQAVVEAATGAGMPPGRANQVLEQVWREMADQEAQERAFEAEFSLVDKAKT